MSSSIDALECFAIAPPACAKSLTINQKDNT